jgi:hypothetical protein
LKLPPSHFYRQQITLATGGFITTDGFLEHDGVRALIEAKATASRDSIRLAIGQLYDYARFIKPRPALALLVGDKPADDLLDLLKERKITPIWQKGNGDFASTDARFT